MFKNKKFFYDANDNLEYLCEHIDTFADDDDVYWRITRFTWDENNMLEQLQWVEGSVTDRVTAFVA